MRTIRGIRMAVVVLCVLGLVPTLQAQENRIRIGLLTPLTGIVPDWGQKQAVGLQMALDAINRRGGVNGVHLIPVIADTGGDSDQGVAGYQRLVAQDQAAVVIGPLFSHVFKSVSNLTNDLKTAVIATASATPGLSDLARRPYAFRMTVTSEKKESQLLKFWVQAHDIQTVTVVYDDQTNVTAAVGSRVWPTIMADLNLDVIEQEAPLTLRPGDRDFENIVAQVKRQQAEGVCIAAMPAEAGHLIRQLRAANVTQPIAGASTVANPQVIEVAGPAAEGLWSVSLFYPDDPNPKVGDYVAAFQERCRQRYANITCTPEQYDVAVHDIALFLADIMKKKQISGEPDRLAVERDRIREGLANMGVWRGTAGMMAFDAKGDGMRTAHVVAVRDGRWQPAQ